MTEDKYNKYRTKAEKRVQELYKDKPMDEGEKRSRIAILEAFLMTNDLQNQGVSYKEINSEVMELFRRRDFFN